MIWNSLTTVNRFSVVDFWEMVIVAQNPNTIVLVDAPYSVFPLTWDTLSPKTYHTFCNYLSNVYLQCQTVNLERSSNQDCLVNHSIPKARNYTQNG